MGNIAQDFGNVMETAGCTGALLEGRAPGRNVRRRGMGTIRTRKILGFLVTFLALLTYLAGKVSVGELLIITMLLMLLYALEADDA